MKIAILTFSKAYNRGANLQCYALTKHIESLGHEVVVIPVELPENRTLSIKGKLFSFILNSVSNQFRRKYMPKEFPAITYKSSEELCKDYPKADLYIVGSDQVWNPLLTKDFGEKAFFFDFLGKEPRISYAASFGEKEWPEQIESHEIKELLTRFSHISVRETTGQVICKSKFGINSAKLVLDPVYLLNDYSHLIRNRRNKKNSGYILHYPLSNNKDGERIATTVQNDMKKEHVSFSTKKDKKSLLRSVFCPVSKWVENIAYSDFVVTNSFHAMSLAIILNRQFVVYPPIKGREDRLLTMLKALNLEDRFVASYEDFTKRKAELYQNKIDFNKVNSLLSVLREDSMTYLKDAIIDLKNVH